MGVVICRRPGRVFLMMVVCIEIFVEVVYEMSLNCLFRDGFPVRSVGVGSFFDGRVGP